MRKTITSAFLAVLAVLAGIAGLRHATAEAADRIVVRAQIGPRYEVTLLSRTHTLDRIYESMEGPFSNHAGIRLLESPLPQLLWITRITSELVGADGRSATSREFFCHSNLTFQPGALSSRRTDGTFTAVPDLRLATLVPGRFDLALPDGFGVPIYSDEPLDYFSMSLNLNPQDAPKKVRFKTTISFTPDAALERPMTPLVRRAVYGYEKIGKRSPHTMCQSSDHPGAACATFIGQTASNAFLASIGKTNTMHWLIPPGRYESRVDVTDQLGLSADAQVHYMTAHLHPYGRSVSLVDATTGTTVRVLRSTDYSHRRGVSYIDEWKSVTGFPLFRTHRYELVTIYDNPTSAPIDAMSILYLYMVDDVFQRGPLLRPLQNASLKRDN